MNKWLKIGLSSVIITLLAVPLVVFSQISQGPNPPSNQSYVGGRFVARNYVYTGMQIAAGTNIPIGAGTISLNSGSTRLPDGRTIVPFFGGFNSLGQPGPYPFVPISVGAGTAQETVTPTAISGCYINAPVGNCKITATFAKAHGQGEIVTSSTAGIAEAALDAYFYGGGTVVVDSSLVQIAGSYAAVAADMVAAPVMPFVTLEDTRTGVARNWNPTANGVFLPAPTLPAINIAGQAACDTTHQMCSDATVAGSASWGGTVYACWTYVDILGNEGPCSATTNWTSVASKAIDLGIPAASPGAVGAVPYLSLSGGTYILAYQIPVTASLCTMTTLETITPACAVTNNSYGQVGSTFGAGGLFTTGGAQITTYPLNTAQLYPDLATTAQTITGQHALTNSSITYSYAPGSRVGACGASSSNVVGAASAGAISGSSATTVPQPVTSWTIPAGCFNYIGAEFRVSGKFVYTDGGSGTSTIVAVGWDSALTNTASVATPLCNINDTFTSVSGADTVVYTCTVKVLTTGTGGTAEVNGMSAGAISAGATTLQRVSLDNGIAATAAINLTVPARITVFFEAVGATSNPGAHGLESALEVLN